MNELSTELGLQLVRVESCTHGDKMHFLWRNFFVRPGRLDRMLGMQVVRPAGLHTVRYSLKRLPMGPPLHSYSSLPPPNAGTSPDPFKSLVRTISIMLVGGAVVAVGGYYTGRAFLARTSGAPQKKKSEAKALKDTLPFELRILLFAVAAVAFVAFNGVVLPFLLASRRRYGRIPYLPSGPTELDSAFRMLRLAHPDPQGSARFVDLGSGDGRVVIEAAKQGYNAIGYELNPWLVWYSRRQAAAAGLQHRAQFTTGDFWKANLSQADVVMVYALAQVMPQLKAKLDTELRPGTLVVSNTFEFPDWRPVERERNVMLYQVTHEPGPPYDTSAAA
eukprot:TRINITY_DN3113_c0_g1_i5.p1 TRINITY_DN3113_c0_g1~~TRINITY_DN3113_c0_g1_i5.p1  ORF type:complete len:333 (-),score=61.47 TRINITY_DN3113_c0_g1_i5:195-1193(-)